jgi:hypothetical protein
MLTTDCHRTISVRQMHNVTALSRRIKNDNLGTSSINFHFILLQKQVVTKTTTGNKQNVPALFEYLDTNVIVSNNFIQAF